MELRDQLADFEEISVEIIKKILPIKKQFKGGWNRLLHKGNWTISIMFDDYFSTWAVQCEDMVEYHNKNRNFTLDKSVIYDLQTMDVVLEQMNNLNNDFHVHYPPKKRELNFN